MKLDVTGAVQIITTHEVLGTHPRLGLDGAETAELIDPTVYVLQCDLDSCEPVGVDHELPFVILQFRADQIDRVLVRPMLQTVLQQRVTMGTVNGVQATRFLGVLRFLPDRARARHPAHRLARGELGMGGHSTLQTRAPPSTVRLVNLRSRRLP